MLTLLKVDWDRPLLVMLMLCATVIVCVGLWALTKIKG